MIELVWVVDDLAETPYLAEHGLAIWIRTPDGNALLDTGGSGEVLLHNLAQLGLDPGDLDAVVLSHAHDDHTGGLEALLPLLRRGTALHAHPTLFRPRFTSTSELVDRGLKLTEDVLSAGMDVRLSRSAEAVLPDVWTTGDVTPRPYPEGRGADHRVLLDGVLVPDPYEDDLSLVIRVAPGRHFLLCGCCHAGLLNTLDTVGRTWTGQLVGVGGGVHLTGASPELIGRTAAALHSTDGLERLWLGHCSGDAFLETLRHTMPGHVFRRGAAGQSLMLRSD